MDKAGFYLLRKNGREWPPDAARCRSMSLEKFQKGSFEEILGNWRGFENFWHI